MIKNRLSGLSTVLIIILTISGSFSSNAQETLILDDLIQEAVNNNPQLISFYSKSLADEAKIPQVGSLPDPVLSFNLMNLPVNSFDFDQEPMTGKQIGLMQKFPFPGKLTLKEKIFSMNAEVSQQKYNELKNQVISEIKKAYYDLFFVDTAVKTTEKNQSLLTEFVKIAETKYSVGKGLQQDVLKAQVELSKMMDKLIQLQQKREVLEARINTLLNRPVDAELGQASEPAFTDLAGNYENIKQISLENRPLIKAWQAMKKQSVERVNLAYKEYWPDFSIGVAYTQRDELQNGMPGYDFLSGGISLNLPIYFSSKQSKKVEESKYGQKAVEENYKNVINQVLFSVDNKWSEAQKNAKLVGLFKTGIIPQASQSLKSAMTGYQTDKVDFLTLINNQMTLFNYELDYYRVLSDYNKNIAELEFIAGANLQ